MALYLSRSHSFIRFRGCGTIGVRAIFFQGGGGGGEAINHLPKKLFQVAQIFTKQSNRQEGHTMQRA